MADQKNTGGMIALVPSDPDSLTVPGGDPADELHCTLAYLGDDASKFSDAQVAALHQHVGQMAANLPTMEHRIMGHAKWNPDGGPDGDKDPATVYHLQSHPQLNEAADYARDGATRALGADMPDQHDPFLPHVTAGYGVDPGKLSATGPVKFDKLRLALGDTNTDFPLRTPSVDGGARQFAATVDADPVAKADAPVPTLDEDNGIPLNFPVIIVEGIETSDGRYIEPGSLTHRSLPLPVLAQTKNPDGGQGHDGAEVVGRLDVLERVPGPEVTDKETGQPFPEGTFVWRGSGYGDPDAAGIKLAQKGYLTGNSADLVDISASMGDDEGGDRPRVTLTNGEIAATTLVPIPAFAQSYVQVNGQDMTPNAETITASASPAWRSPELGDDCALCAATGHDGFAITAKERKKAAAAGHALPDGSYPIESQADLEKAIHAVGRGGADHDAIRKHIIQQAKRLKLDKLIPSNWSPDGSMQAAATINPPRAELFANPELTGLTALTIDDPDADGYMRVYGHLAGWGVCHTAYANKCVLAPHSGTDYAHFTVGAVRTADGDDIPVGHITMGEGGHAGTALSAVDAAAHYDNINTVVADVVMGEDEFGPWFSGAVRPYTTPEQVVALRASALSGDWRNIGGNLELVAALAVNTPGFPIPRARVASGVPLALVAAGVVPHEDQETPKSEPIIDHVELAVAVADELERRTAAAADRRARSEAALAALGLDLNGRYAASRVALYGEED